MKYLVWISCCLLAACTPEQRPTSPDGGTHGPQVLLTQLDTCKQMYDELQQAPSPTKPLPATFHVAVDIEDISSGEGNVNFYAVCNDKLILTPSTAFGPGNIEFTSDLPATVYVRLIPSSGVKWTTKSGLRDPSIDLTDKNIAAGQVPAANDWLYCGNPTPLTRKITPYDVPNSNHQYIVFSLCPPPNKPGNTVVYKYRINLQKTVVTPAGASKDVPYDLDPQIWHHAP